MTDALDRQEPLSKTGDWVDIWGSNIYRVTIEIQIYSWYTPKLRCCVAVFLYCLILLRLPTILQLEEKPHGPEVLFSSWNRHSDSPEGQLITMWNLTQIYQLCTLKFEPVEQNLKICKFLNLIEPFPSLAGSYLYFLFGRGYFSENHTRHSRVVNTFISSEGAC